METQVSREAAAPTWRLSLVGGFTLTRDGHAVHPTPLGQRIIAYLALSPHALPRARLAGTLWSDYPTDRALANLRAGLWRLRDSESPVKATRWTVFLSEDLVVDVAVLRDFAERALGDTGVHPHLEGPLSDLARAGEILPDWDDEWLHVERERFIQIRLHALEVLCEHYAAIGQFGIAVELCLAAVADAPLRESAQRQLIRVYLAEGNRADAMRQYESYRRAMHDELGLDAAADITELLATPG